MLPLVPAVGNAIMTYIYFVKETPLALRQFGTKIIKEAAIIQHIPKIVFIEIFSLNIIKDSIGAKAGLIQNTIDAVIAEVYFIASK